MLVILYFHQLGYDPLQIALLFLFYELFGMITNLGGGWIAARYGLAITLLGGLVLQVVALGMLTVDPVLLTVAYVMIAQALSGIAKDLNKMSAKSGDKAIAQGEGRLYRLVTLLTGSKNALKGLGFFLGGVLLQTLGFQDAMWSMMAALVLVGCAAFFLLDFSLGRTSFEPKFRDVLSKSRAVNVLSGARFFLFGARDIWFVVALPVYLQLNLGWSGIEVGTFLALWIMGYGAVQALTPNITRSITSGRRVATQWGAALVPVPGVIALCLLWGVYPGIGLVSGLLLFGVVFAVNSGLHSFLIVDRAEADGVTLDVGFYYMSNAAGRLVGTLLSGLIYQAFDLTTCLLVSSLMLLTATILTTALPDQKQESASP